MEILVTGGSGFLGRHFIRRIIAEGGGDGLWNIDLVRSPDLPTHDIGDVVEFLEDFDKHIDLVLHFAAPVGGRVRIEGDPMYNADSLRIDSAVFRWAITHADTLVYPSSSAVYPVYMQAYRTPYGPLKEGIVRPQNEAWSQPDEMYGFTKLAGEVLAWKAEGYGLNTLAIRPFSGYGPGQSFDYPVPSIARRVILQETPLKIWGAGTQLRDFVHVDDIVEATWARLMAGVEGYQTMNIASGLGVSFMDVARIMWTMLYGNDSDLVLETDSSKPMGVYQRIGDPTLMQTFYKARMKSLNDGMASVIVNVRERIELGDDGRTH